MTHFSDNTKGWSVAISIMVLLMAANAASYAQLTKTNCGGREEPACGVSDPGYSENNDYAYTTSHTMACDYGLVVDKNNYCQNSTRQHFDNTNTSVRGRQILAQEYSIGADTPINWLSLMGTHNSFSSWNQGAESKFVADQQWSLTDQLQAGARTLMLDVHHYDGEMRLCHWSLPDDGDFCPDYQDGRLYLFAIKEIAYWLKHNPGEFIILRINNTVDDKWDFLLDGPIKEYLGDLAFTPDDFADGAVWPTLLQLRAQGKQIVVMGSNSTQWIHNWARYVVNDARPITKGLDQCHNDDGVDVRTRKYNQFAYVAEDRSQSTAYQGGLTGTLDPYLFPLLDSCGFSFIDVDFLYSLTRAYIHPQNDDSDGRPQASVWSLAPGVPPETELPMVMKNLKMQPGERADLHPFACAGLGIGADQGACPAVFYPGSHTWRFTKAADIWKNGETTCQREFGSTYHFWAPGTGIEYGALVAQVGVSFETAPFWVNYFGGPVVTGTPNILTLKWNKTQTAPAAQQMILRGGLGGALAAVPDDTQTTFFSPDNVSMVNANTVSVGLNVQLASALSIGTYTQTLRVDEVDPVTGQVNSTRFPVTLQVSDTLLLSSSTVTLGNCAGPHSAKVFVKSGGDFILEPSDSWIHVTSDSSASPATLVVTADASGLSAGPHSGYIKVVASKATNGGAVLQVNLMVSPQMTVSSAPAVAMLPITVDGITVSGSGSFCWASGSIHTVAAPVKQVFATGSRARLLSWSDEGAATHTIVQPNAASALTANYNVQYLVKATVDNPLHGSIFVSPSSSDGYYDLGMMVTFTAKPKTGYGFSDIVLNGTPASTNPLVLQITVPVNVVAEFSN